MTTLLNDYKRKKKYVYGGSWDGVKDQYGDGPEGFSSGMQDGAGELTYSTANSGDAPTGEQGTTGGNSTAMGASIVDAGIQLGSAAIIAQTNKQKNQKTGWTPDGHYRTKSGAQGIATGWSIGNKIYPGIGGIIGAFAGGIYGAFRGNKQDKEAKKDWEGNNALFRQKEQLAMQGQAYNQWSKQQGNPQTQMYKYGGTMRKGYKVDKSVKPPSFDNLNTTEYLEPNTIPADPIKFVKEFSKAGIETVLDQSSIGKGVNSTNTVRDFLERRNMSNAANIGLEAIKFGTGAAGDFGSNLTQELLTEAQNSKYQRVGLPGAASQAEEYQKLPPIKPATKYPKVPSASTTTVKKPLVQKANGGRMRKPMDPSDLAISNVISFRNRDKEAIQRAYMGDKQPSLQSNSMGAPELAHLPDSERSTHYMEWETDRTGANPVVYPTINNTERGLIYNGYKGAVEAGNLISVPSNKVAQMYSSEGYKESTGMKRAYGGSLRKTSSTSTEVHGPSHANGGVQVPQANAELEGGETIMHSADEDYVFSQQLGFAELHKKIAKSRGKIEVKPATFERLNSLRAISEKEQMLKQAQENIRSQYNLK